MRSDWLRRPNLAQPCPSQSVFINASSKHSPSQAEPQFLMPVIKIDNVLWSPCPHQISVILGSYRLNYTSLESPWQEETFCKSNFFNGRMAWKRYSLTFCFFAATLVSLPVCCLYVYVFICLFTLFVSLFDYVFFDFLTNWRIGELANWRTGEISRIANSLSVKCWMVDWRTGKCVTRWNSQIVYLMNWWTSDLVNWLTGDLRTGELANWRTGENSRIVNSWIVKWTGEQGNSGMKAEVNARIDLMR